MGAEPERGHSIDLLVLLPTVLLAVLLAVTSETNAMQSTVERLFVLWVSLCLLLIAGTRLGLALPDATGRDVIVTGAALCVAVTANLANDPAIANALLAVGHAAQGAWDALGVGAGKVPAKYGRRRLRQTSYLVATLIAAIFLTA